MKRLSSITITAITTLLISQAQAELRTWTDIYGHTVEAELVENLNGTVTLANTDGREAQLSISELSADDQKYVLINTPPKITIKVNKLTSRQNEGFSFENPNNDAHDRDVQVQTTSQNFRISLSKGSIPYSKPITAEFYVIGYKKGPEEFVVLSKAVEKVDFDQPDSKNKFEFTSEPVTTKNLQGGRRDAGVVFHGYLLVLVDEKDRVFETRATRSGMQQHTALIRKAKLGVGVKKARIIELMNESK